eukprot:Nk52_evm36s914 gene=Nk52_evmTU36s914
MWEGKSMDQAEKLRSSVLKAALKPLCSSEKDYYVEKWNSLLTDRNETPFSEAKKKAVRKWIPFDMRPAVWQAIILLNLKTEAQICKKYEAFNESVFGSNPLPNTYPLFGSRLNLSEYYLTDAEKQGVARILLILGDQHPEITHSPVLPVFVTFLAHFMKEEIVYECAASLVTSRRHPFMPSSTIDSAASSFAFIKLVKHMGPKRYQNEQFYQFLAEYFLNEMSFCEWILCTLPFASAVRVLDCILFEGPKIYYRVGLGMLKYMDVCVKNGTQFEIGEYKEILKIGRACEDPSVLLAYAFAYSLSWKDVHKYLEAFKSTGKVMSVASTESLGPYLGSNPSSILSREQFSSVLRFVPPRHRVEDTSSVFHTDRDGYSMITFFAKCEQFFPTLLIVRTSNNEIFGAFLPRPWVDRMGAAEQSGSILHSSNFFGTGETFVFSVEPKLAKYSWEGSKNSMFMMGNKESICVGAGGDGPALYVDNSLHRGISRRCDTFGSESFTHEQHGEFFCVSLEVIAFYR